MKKTIGMMMILSSLTSTAMASEAAKPVDLSTVKISCTDSYRSAGELLVAMGFGKGHVNQGRLFESVGENQYLTAFESRGTELLHVQAEVTNENSYSNELTNRVEITADLTFNSSKPQTLRVAGVTELTGDEQLQGKIALYLYPTLLKSDAKWKMVGVNCEITAKAKK